MTDSENRSAEQTKISRKKHIHAALDNNGKEPNPLMSKVWAKAAANSESLTELSEKLDISYPYLMALARGERPTERLDRTHLVSMARYLQLPVGQVYLLAGVLSPEDFIFELTKEEKMQHVLSVMRNDPLWTAHAPNDKVWQDADPSLKLLICLMYERAARTSYLDGTEALVSPAK